MFWWIFLNPIFFRDTGIPGSIRYILVRTNIPSVYNIQIRFAFDSEQQLVDCSTTNYGCGGGWYGNAWTYLANNGGQDTSASYPYTAKNGVCKSNTSIVGATISKTTPVIAIAANDTNTMIALLQTQRLVAVANRQLFLQLHVNRPVEMLKKCFLTKNLLL